MRTITIGSLLLALAAGPAYAQTPLNPVQPWGSWFIGTVQLPGSPTARWGGFAEVQVRTNGVFRDYFYNELKAGSTFDIDPNFTVAVAGGRYTTSDYQNLGDGPLNVEKRLWQQLTLTQYSHRFKIEHRYRTEQRWFTFRDGSTGFRQRLRYRFNGFLPLNTKMIAAGTVFLSAYDEIFLNPNGPVFERNRIYLGAGYQFTAHFIAQAGYISQTNYNYASNQGQFVLQNTAAKNNVGLSLTYKFLHGSPTAQAVEKLPSQQD